MCPACISTVALALVGATSTGGLTALLAAKRRARKGSDPAGKRPMDRASRARRGEE